MSHVDDAIREWAWTVGKWPHNINSQWLLTDYDSWVKNPHYRGPDQTHSEAYDDLD